VAYVCQMLTFGSCLLQTETDDVTEEYGCSVVENCVSEDHTYAR